MLKIDQVEFEGYESIRLANETLALYVTVSAGPRILGCSYQGGKNLFAVVEDVDPFPYPGGGTYYVRGGHRLWYAPESGAFTYVPDNELVRWTENSDGILLLQNVDEPAGIQKAMQIVLDPDKAAVRVRHTLANLGSDSVELATWSITQMRPGGFGVLPQNTALTDEEGFWANRALVLWPYARMHDPHVTWGDRYIFVEADYVLGDRFKVGWPNLNGWLGYVLDDTLFVKSAKYQPDQAYYDMQSSSQCYCNHYFMELETLGPRTVLNPGDSTSHEEEWQVFGDVSIEKDEDQIAELVKKLGLEN